MVFALKMFIIVPKSTDPVNKGLSSPKQRVFTLWPKRTITEIVRFYTTNDVLRLMVRSFYMRMRNNQ